jgi:hypothetical protein
MIEGVNSVFIKVTMYPQYNNNFFKKYRTHGVDIKRGNLSMKPHRNKKWHTRGGGEDR